MLSNGNGWQWIPDSTSDTIGKCHAVLKDTHGRTRGEVWPNGTWHTYDEFGTGGENDVAKNSYTAMFDVYKAMCRAGWYDPDAGRRDCESCGDRFHAKMDETLCPSCNQVVTLTTRAEAAEKEVERLNKVLNEMLAAQVKLQEMNENQYMRLRAVRDALDKQL